MLNVRAFRRGAAEFVHTLHQEVGLLTDASNQFDIPYDTGVRIHNLSHKSAHQWIEKTNRYTDEPDRVSWFDTTMPLEQFAHERVDFWLSQSRSRSDYVVSAALLRAVYDIVDRVKLFEATMGIDGDEAFLAVCSELDRAYDHYDAEVAAAAATAGEQAGWRGLARRVLGRQRPEA